MAATTTRKCLSSLLVKAGRERLAGRLLVKYAAAGCAAHSSGRARMRGTRWNGGGGWRGDARRYVWLQFAKLGMSLETLGKLKFILDDLCDGKLERGVSDTVS